MTEKFCLEITYTNNPVLCSEPVEKVMRKYEEWKRSIEREGFTYKCMKDIYEERDH